MTNWPPAEPRGRAIFDGLQRGTVDRSLFTSNANAYFSDQALKDFQSRPRAARNSDRIRADAPVVARRNDRSVVSGNFSESRAEGLDVRDAGREVGAVSGCSHRVAFPNLIDSAAGVIYERKFLRTRAAWTLLTASWSSIRSLRWDSAWSRPTQFAIDPIQSQPHL